MATNQHVQRKAVQITAPTTERLSTHRFLRLQSVLDQVGLCRSAVYQLIKDGAFPSPYKVCGSKVSVWLESEIDAWVAKQVAAFRASA